MSKIICIVSSTSSKLQRRNLISKFTQLGFLNVAIVQIAQNGDILYEISKPFEGSVKNLKNIKKFQLIFPDKLKNLSGFQYQISTFNQPPLIWANKRSVTTYMMYFFQALHDIQNSSFNLVFIQNKTDIDEMTKKRKLHLLLNTALNPNYPGQKLLTYETKSYCALVPIPQKTSFLKNIIIQPFDRTTWVLFGVSMASSVAIWRIFQDRGAVDSHWKLAAGIFIMFVGQGANFSRQNRFVLAVLLNVICLSILVLKINYESLIASCAIDPIDENRLQTVQDLLASNFEITANKAFVNVFKNTSEYGILSSRISISNEPMTSTKSTLMIQQKFVFIRLCSTAEFVLTHRLPKGKIVSDFYYILPEELIPQFVRLEASYMNPFIERFQYYIDLSFQAGLPHIWKVFTHQSYSKSKKFQPESEADILKLKDLLTLFVVIGILFALAALMLLLEIFYHDCIRLLNLRRRLFKFWNRKLVKKRLKVRKIFVVSRQR